MVLLHGGGQTRHSWWEPYALVGASLGGITSLQAIADGLRPAALVLVDIVLRPQRSGVERIRAFMKSHPNGFASLEEAVEMVAAYNPHRLRWHWAPRIVETDLDEDLAAMDAMFDRLPSDWDCADLCYSGAHRRQ